MKRRGFRRLYLAPVLALIAFGMSNAEIGKELFLSVDTVKTYVRRLYGKLGVRNRAQAALYAATYHVMPPAARQANWVRESVS